MAGKLDQTWQVGLGWGILLTLITIVGVWLGVTRDSTMPIGLGFLGWIGFLLWIEKGVTK